jgi:L-arabinose isomerase
MNKPFVIEAGHWEESDVLNRVLAHVRSASVATAMQNARIGRIGPAFKGMGDFDVAADVLKKTIGIETIDCSTAQLRELLPAPDDKRIDEELAEDQKIFDTSGLPLETHRNSLRIGLAVRNLIERERLTGFSANFMNFNRDDGMPTLPFLEASKAMARGIGYAGEGDVLTSALTGALLSVYPETSFTEMFCPDWKNNTIFLSHMGELNYKLVNGKAKLSEKALPYIPIDPPAVASGCFKAGPACLVNLAPMPEDEFLLLVAPVSMLDIKGKDRMDGMVRGWFKPELPLNDFLAEYSECGGTHHSALTYNVSADELIAFADLMGWDSVIL